MAAQVGQNTTPGSVMVPTCTYARVFTPSCSFHLPACPAAPVSHLHIVGYACQVFAVLLLRLGLGLPAAQASCRWSTVCSVGSRPCMCRVRSLQGGSAGRTTRQQDSFGGRQPAAHEDCWLPLQGLCRQFKPAGKAKGMILGHARCGRCKSLPGCTCVSCAGSPGQSLVRLMRTSKLSEVRTGQQHTRCWGPQTCGQLAELPDCGPSCPCRRQC